MFLGNSRILLFKPCSSSAPTPIARATTIINSQNYGIYEYLIDGAITKDWLAGNDATSEEDTPEHH